MDRGNIHDAAISAALHSRQNSANGVEGSREIDSEDSVPLFRWKCLYRRHVLNPGIIDENIDLPERRNCVVDESRALIGVSQISRRITDTDPETLLDALDQVGNLRRETKTIELKMTPCGGKGFSQTQADPGGRSRDYHGLIS